MPEKVGTVPVNDSLILDSSLQVTECDGSRSTLYMITVDTQVDEESGERTAVLNVMTSHCDAV